MTNPRTPPSEDPADELRHAADRIACLILHGDLPEVDVEIEIANLRRRCAEILPDRVEWFDRIYVSRFRRLREQFPATSWARRSPECGPPS